MLWLEKYKQETSLRRIQNYGIRNVGSPGDIERISGILKGNWIS